MAKKRGKEAKLFVLEELACMQATIDNLLDNYVRAESELEGHLQHAGNRLDAARRAIEERKSLR
jgi:hypothetical protein